MGRKYIYNKEEDCKQAVIFARVSSKRQKDEGVSLEVQMEAITKYCQDKNLQVLEEFNIDESSMKGERIQYNKMLTFVKTCKGKVAIVVNYVDRLQRNYDDTYMLNKLRTEGKIEVHFLKEGLIIKKASNSMELNFWHMHVLMANAQVNNMIDKVKSSQKHNWSQGLWQGLAPIGYLNTKDDFKKNTVIIDNERAPLVKKIFEAYATGNHSLESLCQYAKELGLVGKERNYCKKSMNYMKKGPISRNSIDNIIKNPFYHGTMLVKGKLMPHIYPPIISKDLYDRVQEVIANKPKSHAPFQEIVNQNTNTTTKERKGAIPYIFRGLITCSKCGHVMTPEKHIGRKGQIYINLKCANSRNNCCQKSLNENDLIKQLNAEIFNKMQFSKPMLDLLKKNVLKHLENESEISLQIRKKVAGDIKILESKNERLYDDYNDRILSKEAYFKKKSEIESEIQDLQNTIEKYAIVSSEMKEVVENIIDISGNAKILMETGTVSQKRELLRLIITDCVADDKTFRYTLQKPFDKLISGGEDFLSISANTLKDFTILANNITQFKNNLCEAM